jgi:hypothetical protein
MIDSPQKSLTPRTEEDRDEFQDNSIVARVWAHILRAFAEFGNSAQGIVVDNATPEEAARDVVVKYSGRRNEPPYGLIDNELS